MFPQTFRLRVYRCAQRVTVQERGGARAAGKGKLVRASVCKPERPGTRQTQIGRLADRLHGKASVIFSALPPLRSAPHGRGGPQTHDRAHAGQAHISWGRLAGVVLLALLPVAGDADLQVFLISLRRLLHGESRKAVPDHSGRRQTDSAGSQVPREVDRSGR